MQPSLIDVPTDPPSFGFCRSTVPVCTVGPDADLRFTLSDAPYAELKAEELDNGRVSPATLNVLSGPVFVRHAVPGDALGVEIEAIHIDARAFAVYVARWRRRTFGIEKSAIVELPIAGGRAMLTSGGSIAVRPMVGCIGLAPAAGERSSLGPTGRTGGNLDLVELTAGATIWFPVEVEGGLLSLGDLHAVMGRGEPLGAGLECGGRVDVRIRHRANAAIAGPMVVDRMAISFVGTSLDCIEEAERVAVQAAWMWLDTHPSMSRPDALAVCAALLEVNLGGPAGANAVATFGRERLVEAGFGPVWPLA